MIPKVINYCWFGGNEKPELAIRCIDSWKRFFPDYEIKEWNEQNFDINVCPYVKEAYTAKKWAFVSDYARYWVLCQHGGVYFDTDVEVLKPMDSILSAGGFLGREYHGKEDYPVNPGLGMAVGKGNALLVELITYYNTLHFQNEDGSLNLKTIVDYTTEVAEKYGFSRTQNVFQEIQGIRIYPSDFFSPQNMYTGEVVKTDNSHSIHYYVGSWDTPTVQQGLKIKREAVAKYGHLLGKAVYYIKYSIYIIQNDGIGAFLKKMRKK